MPYLGNNHIAGDHVNNFKVLDDISSYTATFDGSATSVVDTTNNTIRVVEHRFIQGQRVTYTNGSGGNIGGLTSGTAYFVIYDTAFTIKLATNASNAANNTAINLSSVGSGTSHTLNAAFDGVNTKFKLTHGSGTGARLNNATQLNVAINNVVQRPNQSALTFTEGFAIEDNHKIVFKVAPTSEDIFWGSIIANTITTFDISDHKIDTFTGDGSTTEFTLSHTPANNESLMVTINGVLQHPSNASTTRAYTLIASIIQFTAAPGVGDEIQVRHLGFAGATTADVSGFYGRTGNVVLTSNDHITTGNINAGIVTATSFDGTFSSSVGGSNANFTGIVTAGTFKGGNIDAVDGAFSGNVTIGGTLTYEDVTNIDSVGIITAQKDVHVGAGLSVVGVTTTSDLTVEKSGNLNVNIKSTGGWGALEVGGATAGYIDIKKPFSDDFDFRLMHDGGNSYISVPYNPFKIDVLGNNAIHIGPYGASAFKYSNNTKLSIEQNGINVTGIITATSADINGDLDVDGHTNLDNVSISGISSTGNIYITTGGDGRKLSFAGDGSSHYIKMDHTLNGPIINGYGGIAFETNGTNERLRIQSDGKVLIGGGSSRSVGWENLLQIEGTNTSNLHSVSIVANRANAFGNDINFAKSRGSSLGSSTIVQDNDELGQIAFRGADGTDINTLGAVIVARVDGSPASNNIPGSFEFYTGGYNKRLIINSSGHVVPGADNTYDLGTNSVRFRSLYAHTLYGNGSNLTGITQTTINNNANNRIITGSGTANTLEAEANFTYDGANQLKMVGSGQQDFVIGSTNAGGTYLILDGDSNGDAIGSDYAYIAHDTGGDVVIGGDNPSGNADIIFKAGNNAEKLRLSSNGNLNLGTTTDDQRLRVYNGVGTNGYKTALFDSNSTHGTRVVITNSNNTSNRGLGIMVGGTYVGTDRASFGWFNSDNTFVSPNLMTIQADGKIGIGRNDPVNFVDIARGSDEENILLVRGADNTTEYGAMGVHSGNCVITGGGAGSTNTGIMFRTAASGNETNRLLITSAGNVEPATDNTYDFGSLTKRWANIYTADLNLSNEGKANDVDGTWGQYTIQEGEDDLFLINKRNGKKYMFVLKEVS